MLIFKTGLQECSLFQRHISPNISALCQVGIIRLNNQTQISFARCRTIPKFTEYWITQFQLQRILIEARTNSADNVKSGCCTEKKFPLKSSSLSCSFQSKLMTLPCNLDFDKRNSINSYVQSGNLSLVNSCYAINVYAYCFMLFYTIVQIRVYRDFMQVREVRSSPRRSRLLKLINYAIQSTSTLKIFKLLVR